MRRGMDREKEIDTHKRFITITTTTTITIGDIYIYRSTLNISARIWLQDS